MKENDILYCNCVVASSRDQTDVFMIFLSSVSQLIKERRKERKEALISELMSQSKRVLNVEPLDDDDDDDDEDDERFEEFINEFKSVETNVKVNGDSWKGFVTRASPSREKA